MAHVVVTIASVDGGLPVECCPWPFWTQGRHPTFWRETQEQGGGCMDLVVVPGNDWSGFAFGGPLVEAGGDWVPWCLLSLCLCAWVFGFCCGCCLIRQRASSPVGWAPPAQPRDPVCRWEAIARRALNFIRSRRRLSLAFAHLGTYSLRNTAESRPNLRRRAARRASTPGPILHEGPALDHGPNRERATGHHQSGGSVHMVRDIRSTGAGPSERLWETRLA